MAFRISNICHYKTQWSNWDPIPTFVFLGVAFSKCVTKSEPKCHLTVLELFNICQQISSHFENGCNRALCFMLGSIEMLRSFSSHWITCTSTKDNAENAGIHWGDRLRLHVHSQSGIKFRSCTGVYLVMGIKAEFILESKHFFIAFSHAHFCFLRSWVSNR